MDGALAEGSNLEGVDEPGGQTRWSHWTLSPCERKHKAVHSDGTHSFDGIHSGCRWVEITIRGNMPFRAWQPAERRGYGEPCLVSVASCQRASVTDR